MPEVIITADDFGLTRPLNAAVVRAHTEGVLRYASLMTDGEAASEAYDLARRHPGLGVGLHLDLCRAAPELWGLKYFFLPSHRRRVEPEIRRQFELLLENGIKPTHADGHLNIHVHPVVFPALARACRTYGAPRLRLPAGEAGACLRRGGPGLGGRLAQAAVFAVLGALLRPSAAGLEVPERCYGLLRSGLMKEDYVLAVLDGLEEGLCELYFHPSDDPATAVDGRPTPSHHTYSELETLLSPRLRARLEDVRARLREPKPAGAR